MTPERLQKILARSGVAARRKAEELIRQGRVTVNGTVATLGTKADADADSIKVDGKRIRSPKRLRYLLLNKPKGYLTAVADATGRPTVMELLPPRWRRGVVPVGRLDFQTEGLLLLTDDGELAQRVSHPRFGCHKTYEVKVRGIPEERSLEKLRRGLVLEGRRTLPCRIEASRPTTQRSGRDEGGNAWFYVELAEGRTRQIREMFFRVGHPVQKLRRIAIGPLQDPRLPVGAVRQLAPKEVDLLRRATGGAAPAPPVPAKPASKRRRAG